MYAVNFQVRVQKDFGVLAVRGNGKFERATGVAMDHILWTRVQAQRLAHTVGTARKHAGQRRVNHPGSKSRFKETADFGL